MKKYNFKTKPFDHQRKALDLSWNKNNYALFMEMGTGKTKVAIDNMGILKEQNEIDLAIIIAPKSVYMNWKTEIETHLSDEVQYEMFCWPKIKDLATDFLLQNKLGIILMNVEALSHKSGVDFLKKIMIRFRNTMVILDESTTIKNRTAARTKNILKVCLQSKYKRVLTGSPVTKSPLDLYTQCEFLSPALLGFNNYFTFRARYAVMDQIRIGNDRYIHAPKYYINLDELDAKLKAFSYRVRKDDCLDLPDKIRLQHEVELTKEQRQTYYELKERALAVMRINMGKTLLWLYTVRLLQLIVKQPLNVFKKTLNVVFLLAILPLVVLVLLLPQLLMWYTLVTISIWKSDNKVKTGLIESAKNGMSLILILLHKKP
jgi:SNF2 family DNA or RNA helicase